MKIYNYLESIIIIPTFNGWSVLKPCLLSLEKQTYQDFKILIVDDGSKENIKEQIKKEFPSVHILKLNKNVGFTKAINKGIKYSFEKYKPKYIAILNNDTKADKNWLKSLVNRIKKDEQVAAVTSNMFFAKNPGTINSQGGTIDWNGDGYDINIFKSISEVETKSQPVVGACFGGALLRVKHIKDIGLLDDRYYAYYEDLDWSWRANILGYKIYFEKEAILYHQGSSSWQKGIRKKVYLGKRNALTSALKNYELKNLFRRILYILIGYWFLILDYLVFSGNFKNLQKQKLTISERLKFTIIPIKAIFWNLIHLPKTIILRKEIQKRRKISDEEIFKLINQDETPVRRWISSLHNKFPFKHFSHYFKKPVKFGVNILGYLDAESGVGEAARTIITALQSTEIPFALNNETSSPSHRRNNEFSPFFINKNPYPINIICIYGDTFKEIVDKRGENYLKNKYNIAYWAWELSKFPENWIKHLSLVDEIWVPSNFVKDAIEKHFEKPIIVIPHSIKITSGAFNKDHFSISQNSFVFLFIFDFYSWFERKNPLAVIQAFKNTFNKKENVELIIKCSNAEVDKIN
ncbi:glycosyltransferase, partial [Patescibacteria group bacterium]|nr:glycosyltransferase [Patescibacteria group bacterium]